MHFCSQHFACRILLPLLMNIATEDSPEIGSVEAAKYMRSAVTISRSAFGNAGRSSGIVALSLGAYGATMVPSQEYTGKYPPEMLHTNGLHGFHVDRILCFVEDNNTWNDIDIVAFETLPRLAEVEAVRMVMGKLETEYKLRKRFWISCVFPDHDKLPDGSTIPAVLEAMISQ